MLEGIQNLSFAEIRAMQEQLAAAAAEKETAAKAEGLAEIVRLIKLFGFTSQELNAAVTGKAATPRKNAAKGTGTTKAPTASGVVPAKYRNPETGELWTGRGMAPTWIRNVPKADREAFLIERPEPATAPDAPPVTAAVTPSVLTTTETVVEQTQEEQAPVVVEDAAEVPATAPAFAGSFSTEPEDDGYGADPVSDRLPTSSLFPLTPASEAAE